MNTTKFFDNYYTTEMSFKPSDIDTVIGYFEKRGFSEVSAINTAMVLLRQASADGLNVQKLLDTLQGTSNVQLSAIVAQILNMDRGKTSKLGIRVNQQDKLYEHRNVVI